MPLAFGYRAMKRLSLPRRQRSRLPRQLPLRQWQQVQHGGAPGERLGHLLHEQKILRAAEQVLALERALRVDALLDVRQETRGILNLVQDHRRPPRIEKAARVGRGRGAHVRRFERDVAKTPAEGVTQQRGFPRLARARQRHCGEFPRGLAQDGFQGTRQEGGHIVQLRNSNA